MPRGPCFVVAQIRRRIETNLTDRDQTAGTNRKPRVEMIIRCAGFAGQVTTPKESAAVAVPLLTTSRIMLVADEGVSIDDSALRTAFGIDRQLGVGLE